MINYGRIYFEHHGDKSNPDSGCSTKKVYEWLLQLGALPSPELTEDQLDKLSPANYIKAVENNEGVQLKHLVDFVDAQDNKNYYPKPGSQERFKIGQTLTNAFGLMQARATNDRGVIDDRHADWWGRYDPEQGYKDPFRRLMMLTGKNYKRQFTMEQLKAIGINNPEAVMKRLRSDVAKCTTIIQNLRRDGFIQPTASGGETFIDVRKSIPGQKTKGALENRGVDLSDMLTSEGINSRMTMGLDKDGNVTSITAFPYRDPAMKAKFEEMLKTRGGQMSRNSMYIWRAKQDKKKK